MRCECLFFCSLFGLMLKKHNRLIEQLRQNAMLNNMSKDSGPETETDYVCFLSRILIVS